MSYRCLIRGWPSSRGCSTRKRSCHAPVTFVDIAGIVKGASEGAGLGNKFLANIRESDAICQVVRVFTDDDVAHVDGRIDPKSDIEVIETELILADLQTLERAAPRLEKEARTHKDRGPAYEAAVAAQEILNGGTTLFAGAVATANRAEQRWMRRCCAS